MTGTLYALLLVSPERPWPDHYCSCQKHVLITGPLIVHVEFAANEHIRGANDDIVLVGTGLKFCATVGMIGMPTGRAATHGPKIFRIAFGPTRVPADAEKA
jgi:hypothetical protein